MIESRLAAIRAADPAPDCVRIVVNPEFETCGCGFANQAHPTLTFRKECGSRQVITGVSFSRRQFLGRKDPDALLYNRCPQGCIYINLIGINRYGREAAR